MSPESWVAIDFETATREATSACALGIAVIDGGRVVRTDAWLIQPPFNEYEWRNTSIHGLGPADTQDSPDFGDLWLEVGPLLEGRPLLAHNAAFDMRVLRALIASHEIEVAPVRYACTVSMARSAFPRLSKHRLELVCDHCGIELRHHDAASDAEACARVALACADVAKARTVSGALKKLGVGMNEL